MHRVNHGRDREEFGVGAVRSRLRAAAYSGLSSPSVRSGAAEIAGPENDGPSRTAWILKTQDRKLTDRAMGLFVQTYLLYSGPQERSFVNDCINMD